MARSSHSSGSDSETRRCQVRDCTKKHAFGEFNGAYSNYCLKHTCGARAPFVPPEMFCRNPKDPNAKYCQQHDLIACRTLGCGVLVNNPQGVPLPWFCLRHKCTVPTCFKEHVPGAPLCLPHIRQPPPPPRPAAPRVVPCTVPGCRMPKSSHSPWCREHTCAVAGCHNETFDDDVHRCLEHMPCQEERCEHFCVVSGHGRELEPESFCEKHILCARRGCDAHRSEERPFCARHACLIDGCRRGNDREHSRQFCSAHTCQSSHCHLVVADAADPDCHLCDDHKCADKKCAKPAARPKGYCEGHTCGRASCFERRLHRYCRAHECQVDGCSFPSTVSNGYCLEGAHACSRRGCSHKRGGDPARPDLCREHLYQHIEDAASQRERDRVERELRAQAEREQAAAEQRRAQEREIRRKIDKENLVRAAVEEEQRKMIEDAAREKRHVDEIRRREREELREQQRRISEQVAALERQKQAVQSEWQRVELLRELQEQERRRLQLQRDLEAYESSEDEAPEWPPRGSPRGRHAETYPSGYRHVRVR